MAEQVTQPVRVFVSSGGGIRIGASFGAEREGEHQGKFNGKAFDWYLGTSAGALDAALTANGWSAQQKIDMFISTDFKRLFSPALMPFGLRKALALQWPISLSKLASFIDSLGLEPHPGLIVNAVDSWTNEHVLYCQRVPDWFNLANRAHHMIDVQLGSFTRLGFGKILARSMALPGLQADEPWYRDGGFAENPLVSILPDSATGVLVSLGYPGLVERNGKLYPDSMLEQTLYAIDRKSETFLAQSLQRLPGLTVIKPKVYDVDSAAFDLSTYDRRVLVERGAVNTEKQWQALKD